MQRQIKEVLAFSRATAEVQTFSIKSPHQPYQTSCHSSSPGPAGFITLENNCCSQELGPALLPGDPARQVLLWAPWRSALWQCSTLSTTDSTLFTADTHSLSSECSTAFTCLSSNHQAAVCCYNFCKTDFGKSHNPIHEFHNKHSNAALIKCSLLASTCGFSIPRDI